MTIDRDKKQQELNAILEGINPTSIVFLQENLVTDDKIVLSLKMNKPGRLKAKLTGPDNTEKFFDSNDVKETHPITFDGLIPNKEYRIEATALRLSDKAPLNVSINATGDGRLKISTKERINPPVSTIRVLPAHDNIKVFVTADPNQDVFAEIEVVQLNEDGTRTTKRIPVGTVKSDAYGNYTGDMISKGTTREFELVGVKDNTQYELDAKIVNSIGKTPSVSFRRPIKTSVKPPDFNFVNEIDIEMNPVGMKVKWSSTKEPQSAKLTATFKDGGEVTFPPKSVEIKGNEITLNVASKELYALVAKNEVPGAKSFHDERRNDHYEKR